MRLSNDIMLWIQLGGLLVGTSLSLLGVYAFKSEYPIMFMFALILFIISVIIGVYRSIRRY